MKTILYLMTFSPYTDPAFDTAVDLARSMGAKLHMLHVLEKEEGCWDQTPDRVAERTWETEDLFANQYKERLSGLKSHAFNCLDGDRSATAVQFAGTIGADMIILGCHAASSGRPGVTRLGAMAHYVLERAACPVLVVPCLTE